MLKLTLVTPVKKLTTELPVDEVVVPGDRGELDILPGHAPLVTTLKTGVLKYKEPGQSEHKSVAISWGYLEVYADHVSVLAETAEVPEEIDTDRAKAALALAEKNLSTFNGDEYDLDKFSKKLERAYIRLSVAETRKSND